MTDEPERPAEPTTPPQHPGGWHPPQPPPPSGWQASPPGEAWQSPTTDPGRQQPQQLPGWQQPQQPPGWQQPQQPPGWQPPQQHPPGWPAQTQWQPGAPSPYGNWQAGWSRPPRKRSNTPIIVAVVVTVVIAVLAIGALGMIAAGIGQLAQGIPLAQLQVGQCFNGGRANAGSSDAQSVLFGVEAVECSEEHTSELFATFPYAGPGPSGGPADGYPGSDTLVAYAMDECARHFRDYVGVDFNSSRLEMTYAYPLEGTWLIGDRSIQCIVHPPLGQETTTGSYRNSRL